MRSGPAAAGSLAGVIFAALILSGCGGALAPSQLSMPAMPKVEVPDVKLPDVKMPKLELPKGIGPPVGSPTDIYTRIAHGALLCWFGGNGPLKGKYVYHADAAPPSKGGRAEIGIHAIDLEQPNRRGQRVYRINIEPTGETATLTAENAKLSDALAQRVWQDAHRWAASTEDVSCDDTPVAEGWSPQAPPPETTSTQPVNATPKKSSAPRT